MAVPEPAAGFGLWPLVKQQTGWPQPNEDVLGVLAQDWRGGGKAFTSAGQHSLAPVRTAWGDDPGGAFTTMATSTLQDANQHAARMNAVAQRVDHFAAEVVGVKNSINSTIAMNDPLFGLLGLLPAGMGSAFQNAFANQVAAMVNTTISDAAARVANGDGPAGPPPDQRKQPPADNASPEEWAKYWRSLSPDEQKRLIVDRPDLVAGRDGLPAAARDDANRIMLDRERAGLRQEAARLRAEADRPGARGPGGRGNQLLQEAARLEGRAHDLDRLADRLGPDVKYDADPTGGDQPYYLLGFDNRADGGDGRAIVARGNPDTAANVATLVPGISNDITNFATSVDGKQTLIDRIDVLHESATRAGSPSTSVIGWLDYDTPGHFTTGQFLSPSYAEAASKDLASFQRGLVASNVAGGNAHHSIIGHSYGSLVAGVAARDVGLPVDHFVTVGSLGTGTQHVSELNLAPNQVWVTEHRDDLIADTGWNGTDPSRISYGATAFDSTPEPGVQLRSNPHSGAFDDVPGNTGLDNLGRIIANDPPEALRREPVPVHDEFGSFDDDPQ